MKHNDSARKKWFKQNKNGFRHSGGTGTEVGKASLTLMFVYSVWGGWVCMGGDGIPPYLSCSCIISLVLLCV